MEKQFLKSETWKVNTPVAMENSHTVLDNSENEELSIQVALNDDTYGWFEIYDTETGGERFYGEGGLWFTGKELTDYDGVFELSQHIVNKLKEWGYDTSFVD